MSIFASKQNGQSSDNGSSSNGSSCCDVCGSGAQSTPTWPPPPTFAQYLNGGAGSLDIRTESSEFSLSRSLNALLPQDIRLESIEDFKSSTESVISSIRIFSRDSLPPYPVTAKAIDKFYLSTGQLFYILEEHEARELLKIAYTEPQKTTLPMFCQLFAIAAVGSLYDDLVPFAVNQSFFQTARFYLDDCLEADDFQTMRVLLLLAIYCILEKRVACWKYIGQGLQSAHSRGIHLSSEPPAGGIFSKIEWVGWRKTWRSLVFLDSWLAGTLGVLPNVDPAISQSCYDEKEYHDTNNSITSGLQLNLIKLGILLGKILCNVFRDSGADLQIISEHMVQLEHWHERLPQFLQLQALVSTEIEPMKKAMVYLMHCTYLTAIILLTRRVMVPLVSGEGVINDWLAAGKIKEAIAYAEICVYASKQVAKIVGLLHSERLLVRKCWMAIHPAFNAGLILLFHVSQQALKGHYSEQFSEDVADARKCISALEYSAQDNEVSRCYLIILRPFRELLSRNPGEARDMLQPPEPPQPPPTSPQSHWGSMSSVQLADIDEIFSPAPKIFVQHAGMEQQDNKRRYSEKDMKDLEALLKRVA
ncbi:uncharacterized protein H6S33_008512 [Morchella sextelata]|uniref:uncharacterized protein n=1 Tax=Morchella sextelata TaxID=1174677 RepID=UPI001D044886|nr:uncharacterized protein H6S33_008512 [Morchella sextelata]KAH0602862.1 hypothetical protein H6S33_008512 [Morchella sextelata]